MNETDLKIIQAVLDRAEAVCPDALDALGVYGSVNTGDTHEKSDLDLLILISDEAGFRLAEGFLLDDTQIAYDIYCTTWEALEADAECRHAHLSKLMDAHIVYARNSAVTERLDGLRERAREILRSEKRFDRAEALMPRICSAYADLMTGETLGAARAGAASMLSSALDMVMLQNGAYFHRGVKRTFEELDGLSLPENFRENILSLIRAEDTETLRARATALLKTLRRFIRRETPKEQPSPENLSGTYEEMFSNWKNKMPEAADRNDVFSSFMNLASLQGMLGELAESLDLPEISVLDDFDASDLPHNTAAFDRALEQYLEEYQKLGMTPKHYPSVDAFAEAYTSRQSDADGR